MSIKETLEKIKPFYTFFLLLIMAIIFFSLGRLSAIEERHEPIKIESKGSQTGNVISAIAPSAVSPAVTASGEVIGSKSGKKYYYPWCGTLKRVKPENQVHFASIEMARAAGYTPAANCKGLQ